MADLITKHDAAKLARLHADITVFLKTGSTIVATDSIDKTAKEYFALTALLGVPLHNEFFVEYVEIRIARYHERLRVSARKAFTN